MEKKKKFKNKNVKRNQDKIIVKIYRADNFSLCVLKSEFLSFAFLYHLSSCKFLSFPKQKATSKKFNSVHARQIFGFNLK